MNLRNFSKTNRARCRLGFHHELSDWSPAEWTNAAAGEMGEACNLTKKLLRHRDGVPGNRKEEDQDIASLKRRAAEEIADAIIYADLAIQALGEDTSDVLTRVFNRKSKEVGVGIYVDEES